MKEIQSISNSHERRFWPNVSCKWINVAYHYLIFQDWTVVQTRCLDEVGRHNSKNNLNSIGVALIGNFNKEKPTNEQYESLNVLLWVLTDVFTGAEVKPHRAWWASCPWKYFDQNMIADFLKQIIVKKPIVWWVWNYVLSRYYSPNATQTDYFKTYLADVKMNCWLNKDWTAWDCSHTADGTLLTNEMAWKVGACPEWLFGRDIWIDMWFGKQEFKCVDKGSAIVWNRLDIWCGYGQDWYSAIKNWVCKNTGTAKIYLSK